MSVAGCLATSFSLQLYGMIFFVKSVALCLLDYILQKEAVTGAILDLLLLIYNDSIRAGTLAVDE